MTNFDIQFFARIFKNSSTILIETSSKSGEPISAVSPNVEHILGHSVEYIETSEQLYDELIHDDDVARYILESQQASFDESCDEVVHSEYRIKHKDGHFIWVKDHAQIIRDTGNVLRLVHVLTDISDEISIRENIDAKKKRLESLLHHAGFGMWEWNTQKDFINIDENWCHLIGFTHAIENIKMTRLLAIIHPDDLIPFNDLLDKLAKGKQNKGEIVVRVRHLSGKWRYHHCHANVNNVNQSIQHRLEASISRVPVIFMSHNDISKQKENELAAISALSARNQFFARVSHEIRTPLHGILGMLGLVKQDIISEIAQQKIEKITAHSEHLLYLLNDILDLAKLNEAKLKVSVELTSITEIIKQVQRLFLFKAQEKSLDFKTTLPSLKHDMVVSDKVRLTQILSNVVSNAIKYTHIGEVHIYTRLENDIMLLCVSDTGIGIKDKDTIFDAYKQEQAGYELGSTSTGLGLEIVKKLCDLLGIEIKVSSSKKGSLFELNLGKPMPNSLVASKPVNVKVETSQSLANRRVLIVDDSDINRDIVDEMLKMAGVEHCEHAVDGYAAVKAFSANGSFDIVLMDKHMPKMNGIDATREIRLNKSIKQPVIIALTADAFDIDNDNWFEIGIDELITKPFDFDILVKTISRCLRK